MKKRIGVFLIALCICLGLLPPDVQVWAATGKTSVSLSAGSVNIGETVTVTGKASGPAGEKVVATMTLSWDASVLEFVSCSVDSNGGGGSRLVNGDSFTITLKAVGAGTSTVSLSATDGILFDTVEELSAMEGSSASVTVNNAAGGNTGGENGNSGNTSSGNTGGSSAGGSASGGAAGGNDNSGASGQNLSADNSLKSLTISPGTLSPAFAQNKTSYTATVGSDVTSIVVSATPANEKAVVESVSGNQNLTEGVNNIKIVVKAENGVTATYTIKVTKQAGTTEEKQEEEQKVPEKTDTEETETEETASVVTVNGAAYEISENFSAEDIPADFQENTINYHGTSHKGVSYTKGSLNLLWMTPQNASAEQSTAGRFFVYDETRDTVYPFVRFANGEKYVIALLAPVDAAIPEQYMQTSLAVDEENTITAYQKTAEEDSEVVSAFYVFYGVNHEGTENWYQYDSMEGTYQRLSTAFSSDDEQSGDGNAVYTEDEYAALSEQYKQEKSFARTTIAALTFIIAVLVIVIINLLLSRFRKNRGDGFGGADDSYEEDDFNEVDDSYEEDDFNEVDDSYEEDDFGEADDSHKEDDFNEADDSYEEGAGWSKENGKQEKEQPSDRDALSNGEHREEPDLKTGAKQPANAQKDTARTSEIEVIDFNDL